MTQYDRTFVPTILASLAALVFSASAARAVEVTGFNGAATDIGVQREPGGTGGVEYRIRGDFVYDGPLDLSDSVVIWEDLLFEVGEGGRGELIKTIDEAPVVPLAISSRSQSRPDSAVYQTEDYRPQVRFQIRRTKGTHYDWRLKLDRGLARKQPALCTDFPRGQKSVFRHTFVIDDGVNPPLEVSTLQFWDCSNLKGFQLKARQDKFGTPGGPGPGPTPPPGPTGTPRPSSTPRPSATPRPTPTAPPIGKAPTADLRINALTRNSGQPDSIELDGSASSDVGGSIVRYVFDSGDGRVQDGTASKAQFVYAPGDYRATLTVFDNDGNSASTSRTFSDK